MTIIDYELVWIEHGKEESSLKPRGHTISLRIISTFHTSFTPLQCLADGLEHSVQDTQYIREFNNMRLKSFLH